MMVKIKKEGKKVLFTVPAYTSKLTRQIALFALQLEHVQ